MTRALLLDRDGVINIDHGYVYRPAEFVFMPGIFGFCRTACGLGYRLVVVTNQAGIGRGLYTEHDLIALNRWMQARFAEEGAPIDRVYHCPSHPTEGLGPYRFVSPRRKPAPGMIFEARDDFGLDLARSALLGDKASDIEAALAAGVGLRMLLTPGTQDAAALATALPASLPARLPAGTQQVADFSAAADALRAFTAKTESSGP